ncbi:hypothetical protein B0H16DRAFT_1536483 [Mycena metata]|uniref:FAD/NAD(P)-binding domain-containing protein n=1 Tax=Mycena metata TaxID=1033252 RepID=A0AAD7NEW5_9AGAR|nr:hypothetical protein B0H16DRAFT_1536483 [Mycena metata]
MASNGGSTHPVIAPSTPMKTVIVLGAAYGGAHAAQLIAAGLPDGWRIVLIDRNSHVNHVYILPRLAVLAGHEHKAFIPCDNIFNLSDKADPTRHIFIQAHIESLSTNSVTLSRAFPEHGISTTLHFDYAVYALGSHLPPPLNLWHATPDDKLTSTAVQTAYTGNKADSIAWLKGMQAVIEAAASVLVVGGGALGIQFATDIAAVYPAKSVTLLHSRARLLPRFDSAMHTEILQALESMNVDVILGERLDLASATPGHQTVRTTTGRSIAADLVLLCTGQRPNTQLLQALDARTVEEETALAHVLPTMQLGVVAPPPTSVPISAPASALTSAPTSPPAETESADDELAAALAQIAQLDADASAPPSPALSFCGSEHSSYSSAPDSPSTEPEEEEQEQEDTETTPYPHIFVVGDAADAFGAIPAGHNAYWQAGVAARNVLKLIEAGEAGLAEDGDAALSDARDEAGARGEGQDVDGELERYTPGPPAIKVSLGLVSAVFSLPSAASPRFLAAHLYPPANDSPEKERIPSKRRGRRRQGDARRSQCGLDLGVLWASCWGGGGGSDAEVICLGADEAKGSERERR